MNNIINKPLRSSLKINKNNRIIYNRNYDNIKKGSYNDKTYTIKRGDTLFYIAWIVGFDYRHLAKYNKIVEPYSLSVGQTLNINNSFIDSEMIINNDIINNDNINVNSNLINENTSSLKEKILSKSSKLLKVSKLPTITVFPNFNSNKLANIVWPTKGKVIKVFSDIKNVNKGVDIFGLHGQPIFAISSGKVVYSGNALRGYGNLIIIKHNINYLSAYAHNDTILVHDQQIVQAGQKIATMGSTGTNSVRLHFEIRYKGKSVNPLSYLSQR